MAAWPQFLRADLHSQQVWSRTKWLEVVQPRNRAAKGDDDFHTPLEIDATPRSWAARAVQGRRTRPPLRGNRWSRGPAAAGKQAKDKGKAL